MATSTALSTAFELLEEYLVAHESLASFLRSGHLHLAQAKYSLPPGTIGRERYPSSMHAAARVASDESKLDFSLTKGAQGSWSSGRLQPCSNDITKENLSSTSASERTTDAVPAPNASPDGRDTTTTTSSSSKKAPKLSQPTSRNPAAWFAPLPPGPLTQAQEQFSSALQHAVQLAKCRQKLLKQLDPSAFEQLSTAASGEDGDDGSSTDDSSSALSDMIGEALAELDVQR